MSLIVIPVGIILIVVVIVAVLLYIRKRACDKNKTNKKESEQDCKPIIVNSSQMRQALSSCKKHPSKNYGKGVMVSGKGPSLSQLIHMKKKKIKDQESAEKRRLIKQVSNCGREKSFADEIEIAQSIILRDAVGNKLPKPGKDQSGVLCEPSQSKLVDAINKRQSTTIDISKSESRPGTVDKESTVINIEKVQPTTTKIMQDKSRPGIVEKERSIVINIEKPQSITDKVKEEGYTFNGSSPTPPISNMNEMAATAQGKRRDSDVVFTHAVIVGVTTRKAELKKAPEAGKVVKALSGRRNSTLADDLTMGRSVILHKGENRIEQHKSRENRKVIKRVTSNQGGGNSSLQDNIQFAKSVIRPTENSKSIDEKARENRQVIQVGSQVSTGRRRRSLLDQVKFAKSVINQPAAPSASSYISAASSLQEAADYLSQQISEARSHGRRRSSAFSSI